MKHLLLSIVFTLSCICNADATKNKEVLDNYLLNADLNYILGDISNSYGDLFLFYKKAGSTEGINTNPKANNIYHYSEIKPLTELLKNQVTSMYYLLNENLHLNKETLSHSIERFREEASALPSFYTIIDKKYKGKASRYVDMMFDESILLNQEKYQKYLSNPTERPIIKDEFIRYLYSIKLYAFYYECIDKARLRKDSITKEKDYFANAYPLISASRYYLSKCNDYYVYTETREWCYDGSGYNHDNYLWKQECLRLRQERAASALIAATVSQYIEEHPFSTADRQTLIERLQGNEKEADRIIRSSILTNKKRRAKFLKTQSLKMLKEDSCLKLIEK
ncbi:MAG: S46 family peptidase [Bacteroidaceae bacterium]